MWLESLLALPLSDKILLGASCAMSLTAALIVFGGWWREATRQRRYRDALRRGDWAEVHRLMGFE